MEIHCPECAFPIVLTGLRAGQFTPACQRCRRRFSLTVPAGEPVVPIVQRIATDPMATAAPPAAERSATATLAPAATRVKATAAPSPAVTIAPTLAPTAAGTKPPQADVRPTSPPPTNAPPPDPIPSALGGYQVSRPLGQGGMGAVYLARQVSLDRNVALKVLSPKLAADAGFVARFVREAYAAAQLTHHNVVQVYDIGQDQGRHFYAMEYVDGQSLAGVVAKAGRLDAAAAVGYALQAARGLAFAHDQGLIHRDVKPDNLMLNGHGIVKVADLGLVKKRGLADVPHPSRVAATPKLDQAQSANSTGVAISMGTPAYMAPEQARDAATVDARADVYSLGCTLYDLLTGRPPFTGRTAQEVITKHASEPVVPPDAVVDRCPPELSAVLLKMVAKRPDDRYPNMAATIAAMEAFLGVSAAGPFTPTEENAASMALAGRVFHDSQTARLRWLVPPIFVGLCGLSAVAFAVASPTLAGRVMGAGSSLGLAVLTVLAYLVIAGLTRGDVVLAKARQFAFGARPLDWLLVIGGAVAVGWLLVVLGLVWTWLAVAAVAVGLALAVVHGLDAPLVRERKPHLNKVNAILRSLRQGGADEEGLRRFVCQYAGEHWEDFYETLFGYGAKLDARKRWGLSTRGQPRPRHAAWRDRFIGWVDGRMAARQADRDRLALRRAEERRLKAQGIDPDEARVRAKRQAADMVEQAEQLRHAIATRRAEADRRPPGATAPPEPAAAAPAVAGPVTVNVTIAPPGSLFDAARNPDRPKPAVAASLPGYVRQSHLQRRYGGPSGLVFGTNTRVPIALVLMVAFALWFHQTHPDFPASAGRVIVQAQDSVAASPAALADVVPTDAAPPADLHLPFLPGWACHLLSGYRPALAAGLLLLSCRFRNGRLGLLTLLGVGVVLAADRVLPPVGPVTAPMLAAALGTAVCLLAGVVAPDPVAASLLTGRRTPVQSAPQTSGGRVTGS